MQLSATANTGYHFVSWSGDTSSTQILQQLDVGDKMLQQILQSIYTLTVTQGNNGTISPGATTCHYGTNEQFSIANTGYHIDSVIVDGVVD